MEAGRQPRLGGKRDAEMANESLQVKARGRRRGVLVVVAVAYGAEGRSLQGRGGGDDAHLCAFWTRAG